MLKSLGHFAVRLAELAEAEGRVARIEAVRLIRGSLLYTVASLLVILGLVVVGVGVYRLLVETMHPGAAMLIIGAASLVVAGLIAWLGHQSMEQGRALRGLR